MMNQSSTDFNQALAATSKMVSLDYFFGEGDEVKLYQTIRFAEGEAWNVLLDGMLVASLRKENKIWYKVIGEDFAEEVVKTIGEFIDAQHFNLLPSKIKKHWQEDVAEVIMHNDSEYLIVTLPEANFDRFKKKFTSFIGELVEDPWPVEFKVYNAEFSEDFIARVF